jgi:hypothetical protein
MTVLFSCQANANTPKDKQNFRLLIDDFRFKKWKGEFKTKCQGVKLGGMR